MHLPDTTETGIPATPEPPIAVGGVGGSGTRLIAEWMKTLGVFIGNDLNASNDTLWFTLLFKHTEILECGDDEFLSLTRALVAGLTGGSPLPAALQTLIARLSTKNRAESKDWLAERSRSLAAAAMVPAHGGRWGWKEPNTHLVIERLWRVRPELRYVHVVRHGLDMALSANQNQVRLWGTSVLGRDADPSPARSLAYWCRVQQRMQHLLEGNRQRMFWLDYDALCRNPEQSVFDLLQFLGLDHSDAGALAAQVRMPSTQRHAGQSLSHFRAQDVEYVRSLGYPILAGR